MRGWRLEGALLHALVILGVIGRLIGDSDHLKNVTPKVEEGFWKVGGKWNLALLIVPPYFTIWSQQSLGFCEPNTSYFTPIAA